MNIFYGCVLIDIEPPQVYPKLSQTYYVLLETLAQDHMTFMATLEPNVFLYILASISEGLSAIGEWPQFYLEFIRRKCTADEHQVDSSFHLGNFQ